MATVKSFDLGFTSGGRFPYALARLDCGHVANVEVNPTLYACAACGRETTNIQHGSCPCGSTRDGFRFVHLTNPHNAADRVTQIGDVVACEQCPKDDETAAWLLALAAGSVHHARFDPRFAPGSYHLYRHDVSSPSGFFLMGSVPATPRFDDLLRAVRVSPLSPTEGA